MNQPNSHPAPPAVPKSRRKLHRIWCTGFAVLGLAGAGLVAHYSGMLAGPVSSAGTAAQAREDARLALAAFLGSRTPAERAARVIDGDKLLPFMEAWYAAHEDDQLSADRFVAPDWSFEDASLTALELPRGRGLPPVVACFKQAGGKWLLDWEIWAQSLDGLFRRFIYKPAEGEHTLRARLARSGSGDDMTLTVTDPFDSRQSIALDITRPDLRALYARDLPVTGNRTATVQLVWLNDSLTGTLQPSLRRHLCWGFPGLDGKEADHVEVNLPSKHRPPPGVPAVPAAPAAALAAAPEIEAAVEAALSHPTARAVPSREGPAVLESNETARK